MGEALWGIERTDLDGANTRIYGEIHNCIVGVIEGTRLRTTAIDLARLGSMEKVREHFFKTDLTLTGIPLTCSDAEVNALIRELAQSAEVEDLCCEEESSRSLGA